MVGGGGGDESYRASVALREVVRCIMEVLARLKSGGVVWEGGRDDRGQVVWSEMYLFLKNYIIRTCPQEWQVW